jgi:hypothetical protein
MRSFTRSLMPELSDRIAAIESELRVTWRSDRRRGARPPALPKANHHRGADDAAPGWTTLHDCHSARWHCPMADASTPESHDTVRNGFMMSTIPNHLGDTT